ncbi:PREDICTED: uncharacterized protein LOC108359992 [Rhagoletis zephyria]|uniref:uncharacterized protein LOC108359992 n=1 Tax=Rhagoletis zephyria TaxID=28612 RepID=UPI0008113387|nr:PREDICTED: uncharacterized protein LOC108359992 [Rhagoletis zephyria]
MSTGVQVVATVCRYLEVRKSTWMKHQLTRYWGLNDASLSRTLLAMNLLSCDELLRSIENLSIANTYNKVSTVAKGNVKEGEVEKNPYNERKGFRCFNCNNVGHIAAKFPQPQRKAKCSSCNKYRHEAKDCRSGKKTVGKVTEETALVPPPVMRQICIERVVPTQRL